MSIPCKMRPAGLESLPLGYTRLEFLESTGTQYININYALHPDSEVSIEAEVHAFTVGFSGGLIGFNYNRNLYAIWMDTNRTRWDWYGGIVNGKVIPVGQKAKIEKKGRFNFIDGVETTANPILANPPEWELTDRCALFAASPPHFPASAFEGAIYSAKIGRGGVLGRSFVPALDTTGRPCMFDLVSKQPFYNARAGSEFIAGLTMGQARNLAYLPAPTTINTLTISLPKEARLVLYNQEVNAAIAAAEAKGWTIDVQYRDTFDDESIRDKYAECVTIADMLAVNPDYQNDLTSEGEWIYPLPKLESLVTLGSKPQILNSLFGRATNIRIFKQPLPAVRTTYNYYTYTAFANSSIEYAEITLPVSTESNGIFKGGCTKLKEAKIIAPMSIGSNELFEAANNLKKVTMEAPNVKSCYDTFQYNWALEEVYIDFNDNVTEGHNMYYECSNLKIFPTSYSKLYKGDGMFHRCKITGQQAIEVLNSLPTYVDDPRPMTIGIHVDYQNDEEVIAAITAAEEKGWTLTVQWNGTPTAQTVSTFGLRKPPVYAKLATSERPDGTAENFLDWGHYVTNWEENGYQEFASIEEAHEHFNLEMPAEEESAAS